MSTASNDLASNTAAQGKLRSFELWLVSLGLTRVTGYRYRKQGLINTVNIFGRLYVTQDEIDRFEQRALAGEFHKEVKTPARRELAAA